MKKKLIAAALTIAATNANAFCSLGFGGNQQMNQLAYQSCQQQERMIQQQEESNRLQQQYQNQQQRPQLNIQYPDLSNIYKDAEQIKNMRLQNEILQRQLEDNK